RQFAEAAAGRPGVTIDTGVYDKVRAFRAPNSWHPKTSRHKRRLSHDELMGLSVEGIFRLAEQPSPFDLPAPAVRSELAAADWREAERQLRAAVEAHRRSRAARGDTPHLNRLTLEFI